jgi:hypothetical protein
MPSFAHGCVAWLRAFRSIRFQFLSSSISLGFPFFIEEQLMNAIVSNAVQRVQHSALQILLCGASLWCGFAAQRVQAIEIVTELNHPALETLVFKANETPQITVSGRSYNSDPQGAFVPGGLQAFYYTGTFATPRPLPDVPAGGEINIGRNSEFVTNPTNSDNWWIQDNAAFRTANAIGGTATNTKLPPYLMRKFVALSGTTTPTTVVTDNFSIRMEGQIDVSAAGTYNFSGGADDGLRVYVDGHKITDNVAPARFPGTVNLDAGVHGFTAEFVENGGGEHYNFNASGPGTVNFSANAQDEHTYSGATLELGRTYAEQRQGYLTGVVRGNSDGTGALLRGPFDYAGPVDDNYSTGTGPSPQADNFRLILTGYWDVPTTGLFDFSASADDKYSFAISDNPLDDPNTIANVIDKSGITAPASVTGISLTAGLRPVRFEFGEIGGNASFHFNWSNADLGLMGQQFDADSLFSTDIPVLDFELLKTLQGQFSSLSDLYTLDIPDELLGQLLTMRLRAYGTDGSFSESSFQFIATVLPVPEPSSASLLAFGLLGWIVRRRRPRA